MEIVGTLKRNNVKQRAKSRLVSCSLQTNLQSGLHHEIPANSQQLVVFRRKPLSGRGSTVQFLKCDVNFLVKR